MENLNNNVPSGLPAVDSGNYISAQKHAFIFCDTKKKSGKIAETNQATVGAMEEKPTTAKVVLSIAALVVAVVLACIEGFNLSTALASVFGFNVYIAFFFGTTFTLIGILAGEWVSKIKKDPFTNKYRFTARWYLSMLLVAAYLVLQYAISAIAAGDGEGLGMLPILCTVIGLIEVIVGILFTSGSLVMIGIIINNLRIKLMRKKLKRHSKKTDSDFQRHLFEVQTHNHKTGANVPHGTETAAIKEARDYYNSGGFNA